MTPIPKFIKNIFKIAAYVFTAVASLFLSFFIIFVVLIALAVGLSSGETETITADLELKHHAGNRFAGNKLVSLPVSGIILGEREELPSYMQLFSEYGVTYGYEIKDTLYELAEQDDVAGVVLELHTPGGTIYGTTAIADGVDYYQEKTGKPVVAYIGSLAASGGYWIAASADEVVADNGTTIGSIGVIAGPFKYYDGVVEENGIFGAGVTTSDGISTDYITAGRSKDLGNPYRPLSDEERSTLQSSVDNSYNKFVSYVAGERQLGESTIRDNIGALIYDEVQAQQNGLIDNNMSREEAYTRLAELAGVTDFQIVRPRILDSIFGALSATLHQDSGMTSRPQFCSDRTAVLVYSGDILSVCSK